MTLLLRRLFLCMLLVLVPFAARAANRTAWTAGNGAGYSWTTAVNTADMSNGSAGLASGSAVLSSITPVANQSTQDIYLDISASFSGLTSETYAAGAAVYIYVEPLNQDGTTYGGGLFAGTGYSNIVARQPLEAPVCAIFPPTYSAITSFVGQCDNIVIPAESFTFAVYNSSGYALSATAADNVVKFTTHNINLNN